ncbi:hypothetical protein [Clostridioides sp. ZZV15-6597]|uniref:hypothetical protein n=1 Tax=Clostridioides sp. ZZV15-6597 TaxID=2811500 RepID=UPI001D11FEB5|nr:hypothetical protein [Clostridioides sp. ZZV15-6597]HBF1820585.1 hypothetical protein [Clostridioides difficile]
MIPSFLTKLINIIMIIMLIVTIFMTFDKDIPTSDNLKSLNNFNNAKVLATNCVDLYKLGNENEFENVKSKLYDTFSTSLQNEYFDVDLKSENTPVTSIKLLNIVGENLDEKKIVTKKNTALSYLFKIDVELVRNNETINKCMLVTVKNNKITTIESL